MSMSQLTTLLLKLPRGTEVTPEAAQTFLAALTQIGSASSIQKLMGAKSSPFALEIALFNQQIRFQITCDSEQVPFVEAQIQSNYPLAIMEKVKDSLHEQKLDMVRVFLKQGNFYPIATFPQFTDIDPLSSILAVMAKGNPDEVTLIQCALESTTSTWQAQGKRFAEKGSKNEDGTYSPRPDESIIKEKISYPGFKVAIRIASNSKKKP